MPDLCVSACIYIVQTILQNATWAICLYILLNETHEDLWDNAVYMVYSSEFSGGVLHNSFANIMNCIGKLGTNGCVVMSVHYLGIMSFP